MPQFQIRKKINDRHSARLVELKRSAGTSSDARPLAWPGDVSRPDGAATASPVSVTVPVTTTASAPVVALADLAGLVSTGAASYFEEQGYEGDFEGSAGTS